MAILITGVAGFIGSHLAKKFFAQGDEIIGIDNLCRGSLRNIAEIQLNPKFTFSDIDLSELGQYQSLIAEYQQSHNITEVWHLAANSDIPAGISNAQIDLRDTFLTTYNTLEVMRKFNIPTIAFASTSAVYGNLGEQILTEDIGPLFPISNYGAMKLASEALISASVESFLKSAYIFRFPNVIGAPATHGVIIDFINKLKSTPDNLDVLGNGTQQKSYLHIEDLIDAMISIRNLEKAPLNYFNIGAGDDGISVHDIAEIVVDAVAPNASICYGEGDKGWVGDVPRFKYSIEKLKRLGWAPKLNSVEAVRLAVKQILADESQK
jgi:UDP-glucose 4-epimerase